MVTWQQSYFNFQATTGTKKSQDRVFLQFTAILEHKTSGSTTSFLFYIFQIFPIFQTKFQNISADSDSRGLVYL